MRKQLRKNRGSENAKFVFTLNPEAAHMEEQVRRELDRILPGQYALVVMEAKDLDAKQIT